MITIPVGSVLAPALVLVISLSLLPGGTAPEAGASGVADVRKLARRVLALERQVADLQTQNRKLKIATFPKRIGALEEKARYLDPDGTYYGYVNSTQVWSHYCKAGASALWHDLDGFSELGCEEASHESSSYVAPRKQTFHP